MSRNLDTDYKNAITAKNVKPLFMVIGAFDSGTIRFFNGIGTWVYGGDTYTGAGNLLKISQVVETQKTEARGLNIELNGIPSGMVAIALNEPYQDRDVTVKMAVLDDNDAVISTPFTMFSGKADILEPEIGGQTATIRLSAENDLIVLTRKNERRRTPEDQQLLYASDTFFNQVTSLQALDIVWGKTS
jgi:hypothetical protein